LRALALRKLDRLALAVVGAAPMKSSTSFFASARPAPSAPSRLRRVASALGLGSKKDGKKRDDDDLDPPRPNAVVTLFPRFALGCALA
jgi:hypothetical protein